MVPLNHKAATGGRAGGSQKAAAIVPGATTGRGFVRSGHQERERGQSLDLRLEATRH